MAEGDTYSGQPAPGLVLANTTATATIPKWSTLAAVIDSAFGAPSGQGTILNRGVSAWTSTTAPALGLNGTAGGSLTLFGATSGSSIVGVKAAAGTSVFNLPVGNGTLNQVLITDGSGNTSWTNAGAGTVSSVGLSLPSIFNVTGSPVVGAGTLTATLATATANFAFLGPASGTALAPTFRALVGADLPNPSSSSLGGVQSATAVAHQWINAISTAGVPALSQPAFTDISGAASAAQLPNPTSTSLGGVRSYVAVTSQWINSISTSGVPSSTQPTFGDISGTIVSGQLPTAGSNTIISNITGGSTNPVPNSLTSIIDSSIDNTQGDILYRSATVWTALNPGVSGQVLTTSGAGANPSWASVSGTGTVTSIATNNGITGGTITTSGTIGLATIASGNVLGNVSGGSAVPTATTPTKVLDVIGAVTGDILYRGVSVWSVLAPGTNGQFLQTTGAGSTPQWAAAANISGSPTNGQIAQWTGAATIQGVTLVPIANGGTNDSGTAWTTFTPTMAFSSGTGTWSVTNAVSYKTIGKTAWVSFNLTLTLAGTGSGSFTMTLPFTAATPFTCVVRENAVTGNAYQGFGAVSATTMTVFSFTNTGVTFANGDNFIGSFVYQTT